MKIFSDKDTWKFAILSLMEHFLGIYSEVLWNNGDTNYLAYRNSSVYCKCCKTIYHEDLYNWHL